MKVAEERRFTDYRTDVTLDVRQMRVALRRLRQLTRTRPRRPSSISTRPSTRPARTPARSSWCSAPPRRNDVRLLLLMDVGGTMDPYFEPVSQLLTALHEERGLRDFQAYYFHNCVYDHVYTQARMLRADAMPTGDVLRRLDARWKVADRRRRRDAPGRAARALRQHRSAPHLADARHRVAAPHRRRTSTARVDQSRASPAYWERLPDDARHPPPLPDVPPERRRPHARRCRRWSARAPSGPPYDAARPGRSGTARRNGHRRLPSVLRRDGNPAGLGLLGLRQLHLEHAVHEPRRDARRGRSAAALREREATQVVADVVLGVDRRQAVVVLRRRRGPRGAARCRAARPRPGPGSTPGMSAHSQSACSSSRMSTSGTYVRPGRVCSFSFSSCFSLGVSSVSSWMVSLFSEIHAAWTVIWRGFAASARGMRSVITPPLERGRRRGPRRDPPGARMERENLPEARSRR